MKALVIYDSKFGNTQEVALAIANAIGPDVKARQVEEVEDGDLLGLDLLVVGSPTQAGRATKPIQALLKGIPAHGLSGTDVAAFDTRIEPAGLLKLVAAVFGYAAPKIDAALRAKGGRIVAEPTGFTVTGTEGPLADGELQNAVKFALALMPPAFV